MSQKIKNTKLRELVFRKIKAFIEDDRNYKESACYIASKDEVQECRDLKEESLYDFVDGLIPDIKSKQYIEVKSSNQ